MGEFEDNHEKLPDLGAYESEWKDPLDGLTWEVTNYLFPRRGKRVI